MPSPSAAWRRSGLSTHSPKVLIQRDSGPDVAEKKMRARPSARSNASKLWLRSPTRVLFAPMRPDAKQIAERRRCRAAAADELLKVARFAEFVPTYSRMNPRDDLPANVFYFGERNAPPRIVLLGPWAYVHAPGAKLPSAFEDFPHALRKQRHLGALHARLLLESDRAIRLLRTLAEKLSHEKPDRPRRLG